MLHAHPDKVGNGRVLPLAQTAQTAAEHLICEEEEEEKNTLKVIALLLQHHLGADPQITFDVAFVPNRLIGGPSGQELLELHPGFLLV